MEIKGLRGLAIAVLALALVQDSYQQLPITCSPGQQSLSNLNIPPFSPGDTVFSSSCSSVRELEVTSFPQTTFPAGILDPLTNLRILFLVVLDLQAIESGAFSSLTQLDHLDVAGNWFSTLQEDIFENLGSLRILSMVSAGLETLPFGIFDPLTSLDILLIEFNPALECIPPLPSGFVEDTQPVICDPPPPSPPSPPPPSSPPPSPLDPDACFDSGGNACLVCDANNDGALSISDVIYLIAVINGL